MYQLKTSEDIWNLLSSATPSAALSTSIETGLLWMLAEAPMSGDEISQALGIPRKRCHYWLQLLTVIGILEKRVGRYAPAPLTCSAILETRTQLCWQHLVLDERERSNGVEFLPLYIRELGSVWEAQGLTSSRDYVEKMCSDLGRARDFAHLLFELHGYLGEELAALLDLSAVHRLMDLGGGSGVVSMAFLRKYPDLVSTVIDIENTCLAGRELALEHGFADRLSYHAADFVQDELPGGFDMILMCDVGVFEEALFSKLYSCLNPGGVFVMANHLAPEEDMLPVRTLQWGFLHSLHDPSYALPTAARLGDMLSRAGFSVLPGVHALSDKRLVLRAVR